MKIKTLFWTPVALLLLISSCGPVVITAHPNTPPPPWFYPNRIEPVRYVYFPEYVIYYDIYSRKYLYLDNNIWVRATVLPPRYRSLDLHRSKFVRIKGYRNDNIREYHKENYPNSPRSSRNSRPRGRKN